MSTVPASRLAITALAALLLASTPALAGPYVKLKRKVRQSRAVGDVVFKIEEARLPAGARDAEGRSVRTDRSDGRVVRRTTVDGPVSEDADGERRFTRRIRTITVDAPAGVGGWQRGRATERPVDRGGLARYTRKWLGPSTKRGSDEIQVRFYSPLVHRASLVIDEADGPRRITMLHDGNRVWEADTGRTIDELAGKSYAFEIDYDTPDHPLKAEPGSHAEDIGFLRDDGSISFHVPAATSVDLVLTRTDASGARVTTRYPMGRGRDSDSWYAVTRLPPDELEGVTHRLEVRGRKIADPAAHSNGGDYGPSRFVDLRRDWGDGEWMAQRKRPGFVLRHVMKGGITELHPSGITRSSSAPVPAEDRGTYAGLAHPEVVAHFKRQNVSAVELMPVQQADHYSAEHGEVNFWGYMTTLFNSVNRSYAKDPRNGHLELMRAIDAFHQARIMVVTDVVYNHTAGGSYHPFMLDKRAFYRLSDDGKLFMNDSGTGNEVNPRMRMAEEYVVQSLLHWSRAYHVDGFRFDLFAVFPPPVVHRIQRRLASEGVFVTGEPWTAVGGATWGKGSPEIYERRPATRRGATRAQRASLTDGPSVWNDEARKIIEDIARQGAHGDEILTLLGGSMQPYGPNRRPSHGVNVTSHDDHYIPDLAGGNRERTASANALQILARGIPSNTMFQDHGATKGNAKNIYNDPGPRNWADWTLLERNKPLGAWTAGVRALRARYPHFHVDRAFRPGQEDALWPANSAEVHHGAVGVLYRPPAGVKGRKRMPDFAVLVNNDSTPYSRAKFKLPPGNWKVVGDGETLAINPEGSIRPLPPDERGEYGYDVGAGTMVILRRDPP